MTARLYTGAETLEVVGESHYQDALCRIVGMDAVRGARYSTIAVLIPQPENPYDPSAIQVQIDGLPVGHLSRGDAASYLPGLQSLMKDGQHVALEAMIVCGGDGGMFGVFLDHDPADFGLRRSRDQPVAQRGEMRTGFTEAWVTEVEDDSYDLSWFDDLPVGDRPAIDMLRNLLVDDPDPIDRHFQFAELESRLYRCRDLYDGAPAEYDETCQRHDAEMEQICAAFREKWGKVPLLETYKQMAIRQAKAKDWRAVMWWIDRGLDLYGDDAARSDAVEDLQRRRVRALAKLEPPAAKSKPKSVQFAAPVGMAALDLSPPAPSPPLAEIEVLTCSACGSEFERHRVRGRKPVRCRDCRSAGA